jgi:hypothetical protein
VRAATKTPPKPSPLHRLTTQGWKQCDSYPQRSEADFVGYHHYLSLVCRDITNYRRHMAFLRSIGESKSCWEPGTS